MRKFLLPILIVIGLLVINAPGHTEVVLDGTLGHSGALPGPDYLIGADLGRQLGSNLFHSFKDFNLSRFESATFSGPNSINNVINRVTGGNPSNIDGLIRSTIPANMYFLNPNGLMFGPNARLDVQGSFHASTADTLYLRDGGQFNARQPNNSLLTIAPIEAFGFLTDTPAPIMIDSNLLVPKRQTLSLIGGELRLGNDADSELMAEFGRINLASVATRGKIIPTESGLELSTNTKGGVITTNHTNITTNGEGGGDIYIRGGRFELVNSHIKAQTLGVEDGGVVDIQTDNFNIQASEIRTDTYGAGDGGAIHLKVTDALTLSGLDADGYGSFISAGARAEDAKAGDAKHISIQARQLSLSDGAQITSLTKFGFGKGGAVNISVTDTFTAAGTDNHYYRSGVFTNAQGLEEGASNAGHITIKANQIKLLDGGDISSITIGPGDSGTIKLNVNDTLTISGGSESLTISGTGEESIKWLGSGVFAGSESEMVNSGNSGTIELKAGQLILEKGGRIEVSTSGGGIGGNIKIHVEGLTMLADEGGDVTERSNISASSIGSGNAGHIILYVGDKLYLENGAITTATTRADGGNITINSPGYLYLINSKISTSVGAKDGNGGNITLSPAFIVQDGSKIIARAVGGNGGNIDITTNGIFVFPPASKSPIDASSQKGIAGEIVISTPDINTAGNIVILSTTFLDVSNLLQNICQQDSEKDGNFVVNRYAGSRKSPYDWEASHFLRDKGEPITKPLK